MLGLFGKLCVNLDNVSHFFNSIYELSGVNAMSDLNRGIMKFEGADKPIVVATSAIVILGAIAFLIVWALRVAYAVG